MHPLDAGLALELETRLPAWILTIGDRSSMANAVEARPPMLDHEIVEFATRLHPSLKVHGFTEKAVLRGAMRGLLPESIRTRRKRPFYTPIKHWFFADNRPAYVDELLSERALRDAGLFDPAVVASMRRRLNDVPEGHVLRLQLEWLLVLVLGSQLLHDMFVENFDVSRVRWPRGSGERGSE
jgi:asparagine synthase (glutamine-hydrolysing)